MDFETMQSSLHQNADFFAISQQMVLEGIWDISTYKIGNSSSSSL